MLAFSDSPAVIPVVPLKTKTCSSFARAHDVEMKFLKGSSVLLPPAAELWAHHKIWSGLIQRIMRDGKDPALRCFPVLLMLIWSASRMLMHLYLTSILLTESFQIHFYVFAGSYSLGGVLLVLISDLLEAVKLQPSFTIRTAKIKKKRFLSAAFFANSPRHEQNADTNMIWLAVSLEICWKFASRRFCGCRAWGRGSRVKRNPEASASLLSADVKNHNGLSRSISSHVA
jgi:hypothetical protein